MRNQQYTDRYGDQYLQTANMNGNSPPIQRAVARGGDNVQVEKAGIGNAEHLVRDLNLTEEEFIKAHMDALGLPYWTME